MQEQEPKRKGVNRQTKKKIDQIETEYKNMFFDVATVKDV